MPELALGAVPDGTGKIQAAHGQGGSGRVIVDGRAVRHPQIRKAGRRHRDQDRDLPPQQQHAQPVEEDEEKAYIDIVAEFDNVDEFFKNAPGKKEELLDQLEEWYYSYLEWLEEDEYDEEDEE